MLQIIYASAATRKISSEELRDILIKARANNEALGVSGMLVYDDGSFIQVLEGPSEAVSALVERIKGDPRHTQFRLLSRRDIEAREFGEWSMGFADTSTETAGLDGFAVHGPELKLMISDGTRARQVFEQFYDGAWRQSAAYQEVVRRR